MSTRKPVNAAPSRRKPKLGQNFLSDANAARRIVEALGDISSSVVVEIGPGRGALTQTLTEHAGHLIATELDEMLAQKLRAAYAGRQNVQIVCADFLDVSLSELLRPHRQFWGKRVKVVGNIPYYITSDILLRLFEQHEQVEVIVIMVQKEVADRLAAKAGSRDYGVLTITAQLFADIELLFTLPPEAFSPPPQVYSSVLRMKIAPKASRLGVDDGAFLKFCKLAFSQKRKTLFNNLRQQYEGTKIKLAIESGSIREDVRAEGLSLQQLAEIYRRLSS